MILRREDVARNPAHVGAQIGKRLDEYGSLHGHVQRTHDARTLQRLLSRILLAQRHEAGHFLLGKSDFLAAPLGQTEIRNLEGQTLRRRRNFLVALHHCAH